MTRDTFEGFWDKPLSLNKYIYTENNPITYKDPSGQNPIIIWLIEAALDLLADLDIEEVSYHAGLRMFQRLIGPREVYKAVKYGKRFFDPAYKSIVYYYRGVVVCKIGRVITTVYRGAVKARWRLIR